MQSSLRFPLLLIVFLVMFPSACTQQAIKTDPVVRIEVTPEAPEAFDAQFTLQTTADHGKLAYLGIGGEIAGLINPDLVVPPGARVRLILINGDGMPHDLFLPDWNLKSGYVSKIDQQTEIVLEVGEKQPGSYAYYCTVPGHRRAGQEGKLIVAEDSE